MTRQKMISVLIERHFSYWELGICNIEELEGILLYGFKGYENYPTEELEQLMSGMEKKYIKELLNTKQWRAEYMLDNEEEEMPF